MDCRPLSGPPKLWRPSLLMLWRCAAAVGLIGGRPECGEGEPWLTKLAWTRTHHMSANHESHNTQDCRETTCRQLSPRAYGKVYRTWAAASAAPRVSASTLSPASDPCSSPQTLLARLVVKLSTPLHQYAQQRVRHCPAVLPEPSTSPACLRQADHAAGATAIQLLPHTHSDSVKATQENIWKACGLL